MTTTIQQAFVPVLCYLIATIISGKLLAQLSIYNRILERQRNKQTKRE